MSKYNQKLHLSIYCFIKDWSIIPYVRQSIRPTIFYYKNLVFTIDLNQSTSQGIKVGRHILLFHEARVYILK